MFKHFLQLSVSVFVFFRVLFVHLFILAVIADALDSDNEFNKINYELWHIKVLSPNKLENDVWSERVEIPFHTKRHIVKIDTSVQIGNEKFIEHISLYICSELDQNFVNSDKPYHKYNNHFIDNANKHHCCDKLLAVWLLGDDLSKSIELDDSVGLPIGGNDREKFLLLQIKYKNLEHIKSISDSSGFMLYIDKHQRDYDAGIMAIGLAPDYRFFIPPNLAEWTVTGSCSQQCLESKLDDDGINILNVANSGKHFLLTDLTVHLIESDTNNKLIFDIQYSVNGKMRVNVKKHTQLSVRCKYNSLNQTRATLGGFSPNNEQCIAWIMYYPKLSQLDACVSSYSLSTIMSITGVDDLEEHWSDENHFDIVLKLGNSGTTQTLENYLMDKTDWDYKLIKRSYYGIQHHKQLAQCQWHRTIFDQI